MLARPLTNSIETEEANTVFVSNIDLEETQESAEKKQV